MSASVPPHDATASAPVGARRRRRPHGVRTPHVTACSLDGFLADVNDSLDWLLDPDEPVDTTYARFIAQVGAIAMESATSGWIRRHLAASGEALPYAQPMTPFPHAGCHRASEAALPRAPAYPCHGSPGRSSLSARTHHMPARRWYPGAALVALACATPSAPTTPPVITRPPAARVVPVNSAHEFIVEATGESLAYQWRRNGAPIAGATAARYSFRPAAMTDGGTLDVVVSNRSGQVTSPGVTARVVTEQGPWRNDQRMAVGPSPNAFGPFATWVRQAGVSSLARLPDGRLVGAFQWFPFDDLAAFDRVAVVFSSDSGRTWTAPRAIVVTGFPDTLQRPFDPTITVTERGQLRMYFTSGRVVNGQPSGTLGFYSAISSDGVTYAWEPGVRFMTARSAVDCAVVRWNGAWHLVAPVGAPAEGAYHAVSEDGLTFTRRPDLPGMGPSFTFVGNLTVVGSALRFYAGSMQGVWFAELHSDGRWGAPTVLAGVMGGDPAVVEAAPGRWLLVTTQ